MVKRQTSPRPVPAPLGRSAGDGRPPAISRRLQYALELLLTELLSLATGGWPEGPGQEAPIRIRDASGHGAPKWRNFS
jgi:hypothetical protein